MASKPAVLVTRPRGQAADLAAAIAAAGYPVHSQPLLELEPLPGPGPGQRRLIASLDACQHIIFISGNAVAFGMAWIARDWPRLPQGPRWYAIGETTARALARWGVEVDSPAVVMTSEALLAQPGLSEVAGQRVLIIKGEGGRETLREVLARRGALVDELACYRRRCPDLEPGELASRLARWRIALVLISSGEGLANLLALLSPQETSNFTGIALLVPSDRVAEMARQAGFSTVICADNASDSAMLRALEDWQSSSGD